MFDFQGLGNFLAKQGEYEICCPPEILGAHVSNAVSDQCLQLNLNQKLQKPSLKRQRRAAAVCSSLALREFELGALRIQTQFLGLT